MHQRRRHPRVLVSGRVRLVADTADGMVVRTGKVVNLSISGCSIRVDGHLEPHQSARIELDVDGKIVWLPGEIEWTRRHDRSWIVGVAFDHLVPDKQSLVLQLVAERRRLAGI